jgi:nicotinamide phosphoribosyltransferase
MNALNFNIYTSDVTEMMIGPLLADAYKLMHPELYNDETEHMQGNCIARSSKHFGNKSKYYDETYVVSGINPAMKRLKKVWDLFFNNSWEQNEAILDLIIPSMTGQNDYSRLKALHDLGYLPVKITTAPEGSSVKIGSAFLLVEDTKTEFSWITIYVETFLLNMTWYPCTIATTAREFYRVLRGAAERTADDQGFLDWACHDFSLRGLAGIDAGLSKGPGHLMYFKGTDDIVNALEAIADYAATKADYGSVLATEHSVATSNITYVAKQIRLLAGSEKLDLKTAEKTWLKKLLKKFMKGILSYVGDSFDYFALIGEILPELKEEILARDGTLVIRGDSGNPTEIICGLRILPVEFEDIHAFRKYVYEQGTISLWQSDAVRVGGLVYRIKNVDAGSLADEPTPEIEAQGTLRALWNIFGGTVNKKGKKVLDSHVRIIYGDGINVDRLQTIVDLIEEMGFSSENLVIGIGGGAYQWISRDTLGFALKATYALIAGEHIEVFKAPKTDLNKSSVKGWVTFQYSWDYNLWSSLDQQEPGSGWDSRLVRFENSNLKNFTTLAEARAWSLKSEDSPVTTSTSTMNH